MSCVLFNVVVLSAVLFSSAHSSSFSATSSGAGRGSSQRDGTEREWKRRARWVGTRGGRRGAACGSRTNIEQEEGSPGWAKETSLPTIKEVDIIS